MRSNTSKASAASGRGIGTCSLGLPKTLHVPTNMHLDWNFGKGEDLAGNPNGETLSDRVLPDVEGAEVPDANKFLDNPLELLMAVTSSPPSRRISNFRFLRLGKTCDEPLWPDDVNEECGVGTLRNCTDEDEFP